jgi:hypothetical protein
MRIFIQIIAIVFLGFILELFLPWYVIALVAFLFGYLFESESNFLGGFLGVAILWLIQIGIVVLSSSSTLLEKVSRIFPVKESWILVLITALIGGLVGGFACLSGAMLRKTRQHV